MSEPRKKRFQFTLTPLILALIVGGGWLAWHVFYPSGMWRYQMVVTIETPEGIKTGAATREIRIQGQPGIEHAIGSHPIVNGEAVVIDLGNRGVLFGLMTGAYDCAGYANTTDYAANIVFNSFPSPVPPLTAQGIRYYSGLKIGKKTLEHGSYPLFVRFQDEKDPKSVQIVNPENFEDIFGHGVVLKSVDIEITNAPVTHQIDKFLPSFGEETGYRNWFAHLSMNDCRRFFSNVFKSRVR